MSDSWSVQLDSARDMLARGDATTAFLRAFGALEVCFSHEANLPPGAVFAKAASELSRTHRISRHEFDLADHLRLARNCVAHKVGFEPSLAEVHRAIDHVHRLCHRFATKVQEIMVKPVLTTTAEAPIGPLVDQMRSFGISQFPVVDAGGRLIGTLFEKSVLDLVVCDGGRIDLDQPVRNLMSNDLLPEISATAGVEEARRALKAPGVPALLVLELGRPMGIVTRFDIIG